MINEKIDRKKLVKICKSLTKNERKELFFILKDEVAPTMITFENIAKSKYPAERTEIQYNG